MDWEGATLMGLAPTDLPAEGAPITASVRLEKLSFHPERPATGNALQGRVVGKTFLGSRMAMQISVGDKGNALLRAYVDSKTGQLVGATPVRHCRRPPTACR